MPFARTLPARIAPRFARVPRWQATTPAGSFELLVARGFLVRLRGLARLDPQELVPLLIPRCRSVHTLGMRAPIDVVWLELAADDARVLAADEAVAPGALARAPRGAARGRTAALELGQGDARILGLSEGQSLTLRS